MAAGFSISLEPHSNGCHVVRLVGELDIAATDDVTRFLSRLHGRVRLECPGLTFLDAAGLSCLIQAAARLDHLHLVDVVPAVRRVFELTDTTWLLESPDPSPVNREKGASDAESIRSVP